jgi:hypothetical protein
MVKFGDQDFPPLLAASSIPLHNSFAVLSFATSLRSVGVQASLTSESGNVHCFHKLCSTCLLTARFSRCIVRTFVNLLLLSLQFRLCFFKSAPRSRIVYQYFNCDEFTAAFGLPDALLPAGMVQAFGGLGQMEHDAPVAADPMGNSVAHQAPVAQVAAPIVAAAPAPAPAVPPAQQVLPAIWPAVHGMPRASGMPAHYPPICGALQAPPPSFPVFPASPAWDPPVPAPAAPSMAAPAAPDPVNHEVRGSNPGNVPVFERSPKGCGALGCGAASLKLLKWHSAGRGGV